MRIQCEPMPLSRPWSWLPAPMLKRHIESPMPRGCPLLSFSVLNNQSAVCNRTLSGHSPMCCMLQASDAPKPSIVCKGARVSISKWEAPFCACAEIEIRMAQQHALKVCFM